MFENLKSNKNVPQYYYTQNVNNTTFNFSNIKTADSSEEIKKRHVNHMLRNSEIVAGVGVLVISPIILLAMKGKLPKPIHKTISKISKNITNKIEELKEKPEITKMEHLYLNALQKLSYAGNKVRGFVFNAGPLKDVLVEKALNKIGLKKTCGKITKFFEDTAVKMTLNDYKKSGNAFNTMAQSFERVNETLTTSSSKSATKTINGKTKTIEEWTRIAGEKLKKIRENYSFFNTDAIQNRDVNLGNSFEGLGEDVFNRTYGNFKEFMSSPKQWTTFITEEIVAPQKAQFKNSIMMHKKKITNTPQDISKELSDVLSRIEMGVNMTDEQSFKFYKKIKTLVNEYSSDNNQTSYETKIKIIRKLESIIQGTDNVIIPNKLGYTQESNAQIKDCLQNIKSIVQSNQKGELENILDIYKGILSPEEFNIVNEAATKSKKALNTAINTETDKFVDKMRDLKSGSAITDVGQSLLIPVVSTGVGMAMADTKEKKRSVLINLGIPLLVGVGTSVAGTIAMLTAGPSLILGILATTITGKACKALDNHIKEKSKQQC